MDVLEIRKMKKRVNPVDFFIKVRVNIWKYLFRLEGDEFNRLKITKFQTMGLFECLDWLDPRF